MRLVSVHTCWEVVLLGGGRGVCGWLRRWQVVEEKQEIYTLLTFNTRALFVFNIFEKYVIWKIKCPVIDLWSSSSVCQCVCATRNTSVLLESCLVLSSEPQIVGKLLERGVLWWWVLIPSSELSGQQTSGFGSIFRGRWLTHSAVGHGPGETLYWQKHRTHSLVLTGHSCALESWKIQL